MRLIIISNRLPLTITRKENSFLYKETSGGLVTGLKAVKSTLPFLWIGNISGMDLTQNEKLSIKKDCWEIYKSIPIFINKKLNENSYNGFCNGILWPILHTFPDDISYDQSLFDSYTEFNQIFCHAICEIVEENDIIWVHDYHLMLLPQMLRSKLESRIKKFAIGFFLHTPFSPHDIFGVLPCARQIVMGILGADHIGFHTYDYLAHFLHTAREQLGPAQLKISGTDLQYQSRKISSKGISIGIDPSIFQNTVSSTESKTRISELMKRFSGKKIILGVDRTDYIKGIPNRIAGFKKYLQRQETDKNVVFLQICVPSRLDVPEYGSLMNRINALTADLNGSVGKVDETYMYVLCQSVKFDELCALYAIADVCCISSLMDGMNLVALEFIACQENKKGVLMLSEFAGCCSTLPGSIFFNPWNVDEIANAFIKSFELKEKDRIERYEINRANVETFTALKWAKDNIDCLQAISNVKL